ncbi:unnamed protein product, partial [Ectocarpus sp. 12 AP-2014]
WAAAGQLVAWDLAAQRPDWTVEHPTVSNGGILHTAGGVVVQGTADGNLNIYRSDTGQQLWSEFVGGAVRAAPTTVMHEGEQLILVPTGNAGSAAGTPVVPRFSVSENSLSAPRLLAFRLGAKAPMPEGSADRAVPAPIAERDRDASRIAEGKSLYEASACLECHGAETYSVRGSVPDLRMTM